MRKCQTSEQVGKSQLFTKISLTQIQDQMRNACIKSYNKFYDVDSRLKTKQKGRNQDINVKEIDNEYLTSYVNMRKYPKILFVMAKIMEMNYSEQNQVAMYLYNNIEI